MLDKDEFRSNVISAIKSVTNRSDVSIGDDETFEDYGIDSLDRMNLVLEIEKFAGKELGDLDLDSVNTINLLFDYLAKK